MSSARQDTRPALVLRQPFSFLGADAPHGFTEVWLGLENASHGMKTEQWAADTSRRTDAFLTKLGWLPTR
jgi:hypothetical protein